MKWTKKEVEKLDSKGGLLINSTNSIRELSEKLQTRYFKNRSIESVRHKVRQLVG
jgi:glutathione synthase/RimK-type ligase-like ATP-grasp enzyme